MNCAGTNESRSRTSDETSIIELLESEVTQGANTRTGHHAAYKVREPASKVQRESNAAPATLNRGVSCPLPAASTSDVDSSVARRFSTTDLPDPLPPSPLTNEIAVEASRLGLDPECLTALPREIALEIINEEKKNHERRRSEKASSTAQSGASATAPFARDGQEETLAQAESAIQSSINATSDFAVPTGMDPNVFRALPREIQLDVVEESSRNGGQETGGVAPSISPDYLPTQSAADVAAAGRDDIHEEQPRTESNNAASDLAAPAGMDPDVFRLLPREIQRDVIEQSGGSTFQETQMASVSRTTSRPDALPRQEQAATAPTAPQGVDRGIVRSTPVEIQRDVDRQHPHTSVAPETQAPTCSALPRTMREQSNVGARRVDNEHLLSVLDAALTISSLPPTRTSNHRRPPRRTRREPRLLRSAVRQIIVQNERRVEEMMRFHEVSRSRAPDQ